MRAADALWLALLVLGPLVVLRPFLSGTWRRPAPFRPALLALLLGGLGFGVSMAVQVLGRTWLGIEVAERPSDDAARALFGLLVVGPLEEVARLLAVVPGLRSRDLKRPYDAMRLALASALGFVTLATLVRAWGVSIDAKLALRLSLYLVCVTSLTSLWGYAVGRERKRSVGGAVFRRAFVSALVFSSLVKYLLFSRGDGALFAALPLVATSAIAALVARRDLKRAPGTERRGRLTRVLPLRPPSIEEIEQALLRPPSRAVSPFWIGFGALVTSGVLVFALGLAVVLGNRAGVDFAAVDTATTLDRTAPPLILLGLSVMGAFPVSGFLVARASSAEGVLEPALSASISIVAFIVLLGLAAPVAVVFGLALGPVAFALTCVGAWIGLER